MDTLSPPLTILARRTMQSLRHLLRAVALIGLLPIFANGADLLAEIPNDAMGFVLVHDPTAVDGKVNQLNSILHRNLPQPLAFLKNAIGISDGVNPQGDFLIVFFPTAGDGRIQFGVWVPVKDYDRFLKSVGASADQTVATAKITGEDLIVARHNEWALIMDPEQRTRLTDLVAGTAAASLPPNWKDWMTTNDVTVVAFAPALQLFGKWLGTENAENPDDSPFGSSNLPYERQRVRLVALNGGANDMLQGAKLQIQKWVAASPELAQSLQQVPAVACGIRLDEQGKAVVKLRTALERDLAGELADAKPPERLKLPSSMYAGGGFALHGAGHLSRPLLSAVATAYVRRAAADLKADERTELDADALSQLQEAIEQAAADIDAISLLSQPGEQPQPVYTNEFVALRVASAKTFVEHANEVMRLWNNANRNAKGGSKLVFDVEETKIGDHVATQYSLDVAALDGAADGGIAVPEVRKAMERLFGAGGKLRAWVVAANDNTVLLAMATPEQVTAALKLLEKKQAIDWKTPEVAAPIALLAADADWRVLVDLHRYVDWQNRELAAMNDRPVVGGRPAVEFSASPPVGIAGGIRDGELWCDLVVPTNTLTAASQFYDLKQRSMRRLRTRAAAPALR